MNEITNESFAAITARANALGWKVIGVANSPDNREFVVICYNADNHATPFVTWRVFIPSTVAEFNHGNYWADVAPAWVDFSKRVAFVSRLSV